MIFIGINKSYWLIGIIFILFIPSLSPGYELIENPKITHSEVGLPYSKLVIVKEISADFDKNLFLARPTALTIDIENNLYVYDNMLKKIFKFNSSFQFENSFLRSGRGPGELMPIGPGFFIIAAAPDKNIYVSDTGNNKIIAFSKDGKYLKDIPLDKRGRYPFSPIMDVNGNFYLISAFDGIIDRINLTTKKRHTFLHKKLNERFMVHMPELDKRAYEYGILLPSLEDTYYDVVKGQNLIIYLARPSTVFIFKGDTLVKQFDIILEAQIKKIRKLAAIKQKRSPRILFNGVWTTMFESFFVDQDDEQFFYLQDKKTEPPIKLYKFNTNGKLIKTMVSGPNVSGCVLAKKNGLFYTINLPDSIVWCFKEEK